MKSFKRIIFIICLALGPSLVQAQDYETWFQAGPQLKIVSAKMTIESELVSTSDINSEIGYQFGGFFRINIDKVYIQPELLYSTIQTQLVFQDYGGVMGFNPQADFEFNTLEIPVDIGYRIGNLRLNSGPSMSILLTGERSFLNEVTQVTDDYNRINILWHFGLGADIKRFLLDVRYEFGLSKTGESLSNIIGTEFIPKQRQWLFSVGYNILNDY